jgi:hypothetical protein
MTSGLFEINSDNFTKIEENNSVYWEIAAASIKDAYRMRKERMPAQIEQRGVYWEARTAGDDIIGRDCLGDYDDIVSEPDILNEIRNNNLEGVKKWLNNGTNINSLMGRQPNVFSPLILACQYGFFDIIKLLVQHGADVNLIGNPMYGTTPLIETCRQGGAEICELLLQNGAKVDYVDAGGWTPLRFAQHFNHNAIVALLKKYASNNGISLSRGQSTRSGCYIATAVYGSYDAPNVLVLRRFRDEVLLNSAIGKMFVGLYYRLSPALAKRLSSMKRLNAALKLILDKLVDFLAKDTV